MKFQFPLFFLLFNPVSAVDCGHWYSSDCVCDVDIRYCKEGDNGATDSIVEQHPLWPDLDGYFSLESYHFDSGLFQPEWRNFPHYGFLNMSISGSRASWHHYVIDPQVTPDMCTLAPEFVLNAPGYDCGFTGFVSGFEGFGTSRYERDGSLVSTPALVQISGNAVGIGEDANYKWIPVDENTLYSTVKSDIWFITETFVFTNKDKTEASSVTDWFYLIGDQSILFTSVRSILRRLPDAQSFVDGIHAAYDQYNISDLMRYPAPLEGDCMYYPDCPTEEEFCEIDPRCSESTYQEPDATIKAGPIAGFVILGFVIIIAALFALHLRAMRLQAERNKALFARRIAERITLMGSTRQMTPENLAKEFKEIDSKNVDGVIDRDELWEFLCTGKAGEMAEADFNALFVALDTNGDGNVDFMEFCAYMGACFDEFEEVKGHASVLMNRPSMLEKAAQGSSRRIKMQPSQKQIPSETLDMVEEVEEVEQA